MSPETASAPSASAAGHDWLGACTQASTGEILTHPCHVSVFFSLGIDKTVAKDNSLAVGFFQRGFVHLQLEM